ncbi:MAG: cytochrome c oxidase subunit 3 [Phaeodactylibacter sp.]|nr:cytochrome c oxidase subunit 3 [Phaeodactylibacter sp.]
MNATLATTDYRRSRMHPKKFALLIACASILMMFAAFTSAYIVRQAAGNWLEFRLPDLFYLNTGVILLSSLSLHSSYLAFKRGKTLMYRLFLVGALILGLAFLVLQYQGWQALTAIGVELTTNPSGSFVYVISGVHAAHILGGIAALLVAILHAFALQHRVTPARKLRFELTLIYWHFVDLLWVYLLVFFTFS